MDEKFPRRSESILAEFYFAKHRRYRPKHRKDASIPNGAEKAARLELVNR
jgi:hypothetical protein